MTDRAPPYRYDPYRTFRFRLKWNDTYVAGVSKVGGLDLAAKVVTRREGADPATPRRLPGQGDYGPITLERGVTHDPAFEQWCNKVWDYHDAAAGDRSGGAVSLQDFRKDLVLEVYNEAGQKVLAYTIFRCWPSEFVAMPELDANGNALAIQSLKLENEGWERDTSISDPAEPGFTPPET